VSAPDLPGTAAVRAAAPGPARRPAAVLFDMDGLLVDSEPVWTIAEQEVAARFGRVFTPDVKAAMIGHGLATAVPIMLRMLALDADPDEVRGLLLRRMVTLFREPGRLTLMPGAAALLRALDDAGVPTALVSSSYRPLMAAVLDVAGHGTFTVTVAGDEVARAKPYPDSYLAACARLGVDPRDCVVLEDSATGARAGLAAGCATILIPSLAAATQVPEQPGRVTILASLTEVTLTLLSTLL
jgi:HAD superfamily hydrolase (TIGR01509 family)